MMVVCRLRFPAWIGARERGIFPWVATVPSGQGRSGACATALGDASSRGRARDGCAGRRRKKRIISGEQFTRERQAKEPAGPRI